MYASKHFTTSRSAMTIIVITLALSAWGSLGVTSLALAGSNQNIPVQVEFRDDGNDMITSDGVDADGDGVADYSDEESKVQTFIGRNCGQFLLDTNTSGNAGAGRTLNFAAIATDLPDPLSSPFQPESVEIVTAREGFGTTYVDLRAMPLPTDDWLDPPNGVYGVDYGRNENNAWWAKVALRLRFYFEDEMKGGKIYWVLHFGDVLWADTGDMGDTVTVTRLSQDQWTIESLGEALLQHHVNWGEYEGYGLFSMPFMATITTLASQNGAPPAHNTRSGLTATWGSIKADGE